MLTCCLTGWHVDAQSFGECHPPVVDGKVLCNDACPMSDLLDHWMAMGQSNAQCCGEFQQCQQEHQNVKPRDLDGQVDLVWLSNVGGTNNLLIPHSSIILSQLIWQQVRRRSVSPSVCHVLSPVYLSHRRPNSYYPSSYHSSRSHQLESSISHASDGKKWTEGWMFTE